MPAFPGGFRLPDPTVGMPRIMNVSVEQMTRLARLPMGQAGRADIIAILGQPYAESPVATKSQLRAQVNMLNRSPMGREWAEQMEAVAHFAPEDGRLVVRMMYSLGEVGTGGAFKLLYVTLEEGRYAGYAWGDSDHFRPATDLLTARRLIDGRPTREELLSAIGPPGVVHKSPSGSVLWHHNFHVPREIAGSEVTQLALAWEFGAGPQGRFHSMTPGFAFHAPDQLALGGGIGAGQGSGRGMGKMAAQYRNAIEAHVRESSVEGSGARVARVRTVLRRLRPALGASIPQVTLCVLVSPGFLAAAVLRTSTTAGGSDVLLVLSTGAIDALRSDDQLAFVIAHELGHIVAQHLYIPEDWARKLVAGWGPVTRRFMQWSWTWTRMMEHEADIRGVEICRRAGCRVTASDEVLALLASLHPSTASATSSHPVHEARRRLLAWYCGYRWGSPAGLGVPGAP